MNAANGANASMLTVAVIVGAERDQLNRRFDKIEAASSGRDDFAMQRDPAGAKVGPVSTAEDEALHAGIANAPT